MRSDAAGREARTAHSRKLASRAATLVAPRPTVQTSAAACADAYRAVRWYRARYNTHRRTMRMSVAPPVEQAMNCRRLRERARYWVQAARVNRKAAARYLHYHYAWWDWMPAKWQRIGACETGYGKRPGRFDWNSGTYQGAFGFYHGSWDAFVSSADPKAGPYPSEAYEATPRQQYEVALAIWRRFGFSGWGCRAA